MAPKRAALLALAPVVMIGLVLPTATNAQASTKSECGRVLVKPSAWLGGHGVAVRKNVRGNNGSCKGRSTKNPAVQNGTGWDCFELPSRLFYVKGWGQISTGGNGGADNIPEGSPWLDYYPNGSGKLPVPGDLMIERYATHGHVTVVDRVADGVIYAVEQNATDTGRKSYSLMGSAIDGAYNNGIVRGFVHSPQNTSHGPLGAAAKVRAPKVRGLSVNAGATSGHISVSWAKVTSKVGVRRVVVQTSKLGSSGVWGMWRTKAVSRNTAASSFSPKAKAGASYRVRAKGSSLVGDGAWAISGVVVAR